MAERCPTCDQPWSVKAGTIPPEPPMGTWVRDRFGATSKRFSAQGFTGWSSPGCLPLANWEAMWKARGPLVTIEDPLASGRTGRSGV